MNNTEGDRLAEEALNAYTEFEMHLHKRGPFPMVHFRAFFQAAVRYIESIKGDPMIHRTVANVINGLSDLVELEEFRAPGEAIADADRLACMLFSEYDPHFTGHEPPGL